MIGASQLMTAPSVLACMRRALTIAFLALALTAPAAHAGGRLLDVGAHLVVGPVLAGDDIAWVGRDRRSWFAERIAPDGTRSRQGLNAPRGAYATLAADDARTAVGVEHGYCPAETDGCKYGQGFVTTRDAFWLAERDGAFHREVGCWSKRACRGCPDDIAYGMRAELDGDAFAEQRACIPLLTVRDLATGDEHVVRDLAADNAWGRTWALAGDFLAYLPDGGYETPPTKLDVVNWRTGARSYEVHASTQEPDVRADGLAVFRDAGGLDWASPSSPTAHDVVRDSVMAGPVLGGDRVAYAPVPPRNPDGPEPWRGTVRVVGLDGSGAVSTPAMWLFAGHHDAALDFDGERAVWFSRPCAAFAIVEWDLHGTAPAHDVERCPTPALARRHVTVAHDGRYVLRLQCGKNVAGCGGWVLPETRAGRQFGRNRHYNLSPRERVTYRFRLPRRLACRGRAPIRAFAKLEVARPRSRGSVHYRLPFDLRRAERACRAS
jgi:hypothetical protein